MSGIGVVNLKVVIMEPDFYALKAINAYLAWDRRTRVTHMSNTIADMWGYINTVPQAEYPDVVLLAIDHLKPPELKEVIKQLRQTIPDVVVLCMAQFVNLNLVETAAEAQADGYFLKGDVGLRIAWAIVFALHRDFVITEGMVHPVEELFHGRVFRADVLPGRREYPELTDRIRQAIELCVVEGMPAHLAADEMGISLHTIRGYVKEGYRILEAYDENDYPVDMTPQERAFMRFTALAEDEDDI